MIQSLLQAQIRSLDLGEIHSKAIIMLKKLKNTINILEETLKKPEDTIYDYFQTLRNSVDLERENILLKIHECSDKLLSDIDLLEKECKANLLKLGEQISEEQNDLIEIKDALNKWESKVNCLKVDESLWSSIKKKAEYKLNYLNSRSKFFKTEFLLGEKRKQEIQVEFFDVRSKFEEHIDFKRLHLIFLCLIF
jgi:small-conductance mechanosensitive channel